jgi:hypothetical protein
MRAVARVRALRWRGAPAAAQVAGFAAFEFGLWQIWEPLPWLIGGPVVMLAAFGASGRAGGAG